MRIDLLLRGGLVVDGTGRPRFAGDVAIAGDTIVAVEPPATVRADRVVDVSGLVVAPGFIDVHTHYDAQVLWDPLLGASVQYGVTTVVMGNCGIGVAPLGPGGPEYLVQLLSNVEGMPVPALQQGLAWDWRSYGEYLDRFADALGPNVVSMVGHSALRHSVMGDAAYERAARPGEVADMQAGLRAALDAGAWGFSSSAAATHNDSAGRPAPSRLADHAELGALADALADRPFGIVGLSPESKLRGLTASDRELLTMLSRRGGASVNWNPMIQTASVPDLWRVNLSASEEAAAHGASVYAVWNPGSSGGTRVDLDTCFLFAPLPHWKPIASRPRADKIAAFSDPVVRRGLADDLQHDTSMGALTARLRSMWDLLRVTEVRHPSNRQYVGRTVGAIAGETGTSPLDTLLDIAVADELQTVFMQDDVRGEGPEAAAAFEGLVRSPHVLFGGTDAGAHVDMMANESLFARTIEWRVRDAGSLALEEAVRRFTSDIARAIGLPHRGSLAPGMAADVVVFDPTGLGASDVRLRTDLPGGAAHLVTEAQGIGLVIVNGVVTFADGAPTGERAGCLLRSGEVVTEIQGGAR